MHPYQGSQPLQFCHKMFNIWCPITTLRYTIPVIYKSYQLFVTENNVETYRRQFFISLSQVCPNCIAENLILPNIRILKIICFFQFPILSTLPHMSVVSLGHTWKCITALHSKTSLADHLHKSTIPLYQSLYSQMIAHDCILAPQTDHFPKWTRWSQSHGRLIWRGFTVVMCKHKR